MYIIFWIRDWISRTPKNWRQTNSHPISRPNGDNRTQRYKFEKIPDVVDHVIIGAGISGLTCGAALAKNGKSVLILEKHDVAGGSLHVFKDLGVELDTGFHYTGNIQKRAALLNFLGDFDIEWQKMGREDNWIFDRFYIRGKEYVSRAGEENLISDLVAEFPDEQDNIRHYIQDVKEYAQKDLFFIMKIIRNPIIEWLVRKIWGPTFFDKAKISSYDYVCQFTNNQELIECLCGLSIDGGLPPTQQSSFIHVSIVNHFLEGGYYPIGGPQLIAQSLIRTIERSGGKVLTQIEVTNIHVKNNLVKGVILDTDDQICCPSVISSIGIPNTQNMIDLGFQNFLSQVPSTVTYFFMYVVLDGTMEQLGIYSSNAWIWGNEGEDIPSNETLFDQHWKKFEEEKGEGDQLPIIFLASNSAKDPTWNQRYPGKTALCLICQSSYDLFSEFDNKDGKYQGQDYLDKKKIFEDKLFELLYVYYPKSKGRVLKYSTASPLTVKRYLNSYHGSCYGVDSNLTRFGDFPEIRPQTRIPGLYLTGQDITTLGFTGSLMSGILTANTIEGYGSLLDMIFKRDLINDLISLDSRGNNR